MSTVIDLIKETNTCTCGKYFIGQCLCDLKTSSTPVVQQSKKSTCQKCGRETHQNYCYTCKQAADIVEGTTRNVKQEVSSEVVTHEDGFIRACGTCGDVFYAQVEHEHCYFCR